LGFSIFFRRFHSFYVGFSLKNLFKARCGNAGISVFGLFLLFFGGWEIVENIGDCVFFEISSKGIRHDWVRKRCTLREGDGADGRSENIGDGKGYKLHEY
jgi:hypothetical protein